MRHVQGLSVEEIRKHIGRPQPEIANMLRHAREYLRQKLKEFGCRFK